jgi:hypothetical protein
MTDIKKKEQGKSGAKGKKLQLNKETVRDLTVEGKTVKGGAHYEPTVGCDYTKRGAGCGG